MENEEKDKKTIFGKVANYKELHVYQKAEVLVLLTDVFCKRFLPLYGDRRVDQMNMAARCGKQNIVEGCEEGLTSSQMEVNLVNVGRASFHERMHAARTGYREGIDRRLRELEAENQRLKAENEELKKRLAEACRG